MRNGFLIFILFYFVICVIYFYIFRQCSNRLVVYSTPYSVLQYLTPEFGST